MNYKWICYEKKSHYEGLKVMKNGIYLSQRAHKLIGAFISCKLLIDKENKAIAIVPLSDDSGNVQIKKSKKFNSLNASIWMHVPIGRYKFIEKTDDGFIFKFNPDDITYQPK